MLNNPSARSPTCEVAELTAGYGQPTFRLAEMPAASAPVADWMGITQSRESADEHAKPGTTDLRTLAAYAEALGGRLEIIADFGDQRLAFTESGTEAARPEIGSADDISRSPIT
jgi:hypothetical protein